MLDKVVRNMAKDVVKNTTDYVVNDYLGKRFRTKTIDEKDPLRMVGAGILEKVMKGLVKDIAKDRLGGVVFDYLIEA